MATPNTAILTNQGAELFNKALAGDIKIKYTKIIFSADDYSNDSDDQLRQLTDVNNKNVTTEPVSFYSPFTNNGKTYYQNTIRGIADNTNVKDGFHLNTYALYASDGSNEVLFGITIDNHPGFIAPYDGVSPQYLTYGWHFELAQSELSNFAFDKDSAVYATLEELRQAHNKISEDVNQKYNDLKQLIDSDYNTLDNRVSNLEGHNSNSLFLDDDKTYGVSWNRTAGNTLGNGMTRIDAAKNLSSNLTNGHNDFDHAGPFHWPIVVDLYNNKFVRIPMMYLKKTKTGQPDNGTETWEVSLNPIPGGYVPACFKKFDSNSNFIGYLPYVDVGCYDAGLNNGKLTSVSGVAPLVNHGIDDFRNYARANGDGYQLLDVHVWDMLRTLFVIEFATLKSDSVFVGRRSENSPENTGVTDNVTGITGEAPDKSFKYRGIEDLYSSNLQQWIDGMNFDLQTGHQIYVCDDANKYQSQDYAYPYEHVGYTWQFEDAKDEGLDPNHPEVNLATGAGAPHQAHQYFCDWQGGCTGSTVPYVGYPWPGADGGLFHVYAGTPSAQWAGTGSRLVKKASV